MLDLLLHPPSIFPKEELHRQPNKARMRRPRRSQNINDLDARGTMRRHTTHRPKRVKSLHPIPVVHKRILHRRIPRNSIWKTLQHEPDTVREASRLSKKPIPQYLIDKKCTDLTGACRFTHVGEIQINETVCTSLPVNWLGDECCIEDE
jgi:hypothetical protein